MRFNGGIKIVKRNLGMIFCSRTTPCRNAGVKNRETERVEQTRRGKITQGFIRREVRDQASSSGASSTDAVRRLPSEVDSE
jgi:hypothetical protein